MLNNCNSYQKLERSLVKRITNVCAELGGINLREEGAWEWSRNHKNSIVDIKKKKRSKSLRHFSKRLFFFLFLLQVRRHSSRFILVVFVTSPKHRIVSRYVSRISRNEIFPFRIRARFVTTVFRILYRFFFFFFLFAWRRFLGLRLPRKRAKCNSICATSVLSGRSHSLFFPPLAKIAELRRAERASRKPWRAISDIRLSRRNAITPRVPRGP